MAKCIICESNTKNLVGAGKDAVYACNKCVAQVVVEEKATSMMSLTKRQMIFDIWRQDVNKMLQERGMRVVNPNLATAAHTR